MPPAVAVALITWAAIIVLYLALAAVLRELRLLRLQVSRLSVVHAPAGAQGGPVGATMPTLDPGGSNIVLPADVTAGQGGVVLAATSSCPLCRVVIDHLARWADQHDLPAVLLTYEPEGDWGHLPPALRVVRHDEAWSQVAHLDPPVLLQVSDTGLVTDLILPVRGEDVDAALTSWGVARVG